MKYVFLREMKMNLKTLLIWALSVGGMGLACILLYSSMQGDMQEMADAFSNMGAFSDAFGMSTLSIATLKGYFATEVGTVHGLGGGMFAAILAIGIISKEEEGHSGEFLFALPISRRKVLLAKGLCVVIDLAVFTLICGLLYLLGFVILGEEIPAEEFLRFMMMSFVMNAEIGGICFAISSLSGKNRMGMGIGIALVFYVYDLIGRIVPDMKDYLFAGPYSYVNASEIFSGSEIPAKAVVCGLLILLCCVAGAVIYFDRRDLAA